MKRLLPAIYPKGSASWNDTVGCFHVRRLSGIGNDNLNLFFFPLFPVINFGHGVIFVTFSLASASAAFPH